jgi:GAF domain-containing protein
VSIGLLLHGSLSGALNVYAGKLHAFDADAVILAETFAGYAVVAMANARPTPG